MALEEVVDAVDELSRRGGGGGRAVVAQDVEEGVVAGTGGA